MARIKRFPATAPASSTVLGHGGKQMRKIQMSQTNNQTKSETQFEMQRSVADSYVITMGSWHGGPAQSYAAGMFSNISNSSNSEVTRKYGWSYIWSNTSGDNPQALFSCMNVFTPGNLGTHQGTIKPGIGWHASSGGANRPCSHWNSNTSDDGRGNGNNAGFFHALELDASRVSYSA